MAGPVQWSPSEAFAAQTTMRRYLARQGHADYHEAWRWSVAEPDAFWRSIADFFAVDWQVAPERFLAQERMPGAIWCPGARVSYAEHVLRHGADEEVAIHHAAEAREDGTWTRAQLRREVACIRAGLEALGVGEGDRVAAYLPNVPETIAAFLATASLGAIWSSAAPEFGLRAVVDRFAQIEPKVLLAVDGYVYGAKAFDRTELVREAHRQIGGTLVRLGLLDGTGWPPDFLGPEDSPLRFAALPFEHPLWIVYSSGTTGLPKAIVHSQGGILLEHLKHLGLHVDARPGDRLLWFTTTGWMMWNFLVGGLLTGAAIVLFDGNPGHPDLGRLWDLAERAQVTTFGTSAAYLAACQKAGLRPAEGRDLSALRAVGSTGSPLAPESFDWVARELDDPWLFSTSGGTDVCTAFVGGVPVLPVRRGELQARSLGCAIEAWDDEGRALTGKVGELVITRPLPSMPVALWGDPDGERLRQAYFDTYPGVWRHGDWIEITPEGGAVIHGRSDSTINRGGVRMGTAEIYRAVLAEEEVLGALVVDVPRPDAEAWMPLFVVLRDGVELDPDLTARIRSRVRRDCSPRHVPDEVRQVPEIPRTLSGKVLEVPVKRILMGTPPEQAAARDALASPASLDPFVALAAERAAPTTAQGA